MFAIVDHCKQNKRNSEQRNIVQTMKKVVSRCTVVTGGVAFPAAAVAPVTALLD